MSTAMERYAMKALECIESLAIEYNRALSTPTEGDQSGSFEQKTRQALTRFAGEAQQIRDNFDIPKEKDAVQGCNWEHEFIANQLFGDSPTSLYVEYEPGNATRYSLLLTPIGRIPHLADDPSIHQDELLVTWVGRSTSFIFSSYNVKPGYLNEKLRLENTADAEALAHFLSAIYEYLPTIAEKAV